MNFAVVILNKYPELARNLIRSIREKHARMPHVIVVADGHHERFGRNCDTIFTSRPFIFARNANLGIMEARGKDIVLANDDCLITAPDSIFRLVSIAARFPRLGILSPLIDGGVGNFLQKKDSEWANRQSGSMDRPTEICISGNDANSAPICFPFVFLSRAMLNAVGPFDENFVGNGYDDNDMCMRARRAGWETGITRQVTVKHGSGGDQLKRGENWSLSFAKEQNTRQDNLQYFLSKYPSKVTVMPQL